jgi:membrane-bound lytic murein transglycosylase D
MLCNTLIKKTFLGRAFLLLFPAAFLHPQKGYSSDTSIVQLNIPAQLLHDTAAAALSDSIAVPDFVATPLKVATPSFATKIALSSHVSGFVESYLEKEEILLQKIKVKSKPLFQTIDKIFLQYDLPVQLKYLAVVESAMLSRAQSGEGARGLWQLMPMTARELGLKVSGKTDERIHTYRSTVAAAKYLRKLYAEFGDWLLVLAAYNSGPGHVYKAIKKAGTKNFWALQRFLPAESRGHVKRFIGVHWFFEGEGSIATQTKAEAEAWQEMMCAADQASL